MVPLRGCRSGRRLSLALGDLTERGKRLRQPVAIPAFSRDGVPDPVVDLAGLQPGLAVDEGTSLGLREDEADEGAGVEAADGQLLAVLQLFDRQCVVLFTAEGALVHLRVGAAGLQPVALDLDEARPPFPVA